MGKEFWERKDVNGVSNEEKWLNYTPPTKVEIRIKDEEKIRKLKRFIFKNKGSFILGSKSFWFQLFKNIKVIPDEEVENESNNILHLSTLLDKVRKDERSMFSLS